MSQSEAITLHVNGTDHVLHVEPSTPLVYVLRNQLGLTAAKDARRDRPLGRDGVAA